MRANESRRDSHDVHDTHLVVHDLGGTGGLYSLSPWGSS